MTIVVNLRWEAMMSSPQLFIRLPSIRPDPREVAQLRCHLVPGYKRSMRPGASPARGRTGFMTIGVRGAAALLALLGAGALAGTALGQGARSGEAQAEAGGALYISRCAQCRAAGRGGRGGPARAGPGGRRRG